MLNQQDSNSGKVDEGQKRDIQLVISGGNSTKPLDFLKETLDQMSFLVQVPIHRPRFGNIALRRDHIAGAML